VFGVQLNGAWLHCPLTGARIEGTEKRMAQYASDMNYLANHIRTGRATVVADQEARAFEFNEVPPQ
jgi:hypothetical protein